MEGASSQPVLPLDNDLGRLESEERDQLWTQFEEEEKQENRTRLRIQWPLSSQPQGQEQTGWSRVGEKGLFTKTAFFWSTSRKGCFAQARCSQRWFPLAAERGDSCLEKVLHWDTNQLECQWPELRTLTPARREAGQLSPFRGRRGGLDLWGLPCASIKDPLLIDQVGWAPFQDMTGMDRLYQTAGPVWGGGFSFSLAKQETKHWWMHDFNTLLTRGFLQKLMPVAGDLLCKWILIQSSQKRSG